MSSADMDVRQWMIASPLVCSYAVISTSVMCTAPAVRKALANLNKGQSGTILSPSFLLLNGSLLVVCTLAVYAGYPGGKLQGESFVLARDGYAGAQDVIAKARAEQNLAVLLTSITPYTDMLSESDFSLLG